TDAFLSPRRCPLRSRNNGDEVRSDDPGTVARCALDSRARQLHPFIALRDERRSVGADRSEPGYADRRPMSTRLDRRQRPLRDLRISVTGRCNFRCAYCMPKEVFGRDFESLPRSEVLTFEEIVRLARLFAREGVRKLRITGGEPLLRRELERLVEMLARIPGVEDIALTTNGALLSARARSLADAGLARVTVSLDALDDETFGAMNDVDFPVARVLAAIDDAADAGMAPVKINMVVRRGVNDQCVLAMAKHFRSSGHILRMIEFMD